MLNAGHWKPEGEKYDWTVAEGTEGAKIKLGVTKGKKRRDGIRKHVGLWDIKSPSSYGDWIYQSTVRKPDGAAYGTETEWRGSCSSQELELATVVKDDDFEENGPWRTLRVSIDTSKERPCYELVLEYPAIGEPGACTGRHGVTYGVMEKPVLPLTGPLDP